jgi:hypothetical protein
MLESLVIAFVITDSELSFGKYHPDKFSSLMRPQNITSFVFLSQYDFCFLYPRLFTIKLLYNFSKGHILFGLDPLILCMLFIELAVKEHPIEMFK